MEELLGQLLSGVVDILPRVRFNKGSRVDRAMMALYASIIEQTDSAYNLMKLGKRSGVDIILRASFEAHVDLINLANDAKYFDQMQYAFHEDSIKLITEGISGANPFMESFPDNPDTAESLKEHRAELAELRKTVTPLKIGERFTLAGMGPVYRSIYRILCNESHNNVRALMSRHFRFDTGDVEMVIFDSPRETDLMASYDGFINILLGATMIIHVYFKTGSNEAVDALRAKSDAYYAEHEIVPSEDEHSLS